MRPINLSQIKSSRQVSVKHQWLQQLINHNFQCNDPSLKEEKNGFLNPCWPQPPKNGLSPQLIARVYQIWWQQHTTHKPPINKQSRTLEPDPHQYHRIAYWHIFTPIVLSHESINIDQVHLGNYIIQQPFQN